MGPGARRLASVDIRPESLQVFCSRELGIDGEASAAPELKLKVRRHRGHAGVALRVDHTPLAEARAESAVDPW